jgi:hypothetical protein
MISRLLCFILLFNGLISLNLFAQDSSIMYEGRLIQLKEVVIQKGMDVPGFLLRLKDDTSFYKSFKYLRTLNFKAINDVRILDRKGRLEASLNSTTTQSVVAGCRSMQVIEEKTTGDFYDDNKDYNYYTAALYASLFFTKGKICGENDIVGNAAFNIYQKKGMDRHREQLKMLFFNPGVPIPGVPFMGEKISLFDKDVTGRYEMQVDYETYQGEPAFMLHIVKKDDLSYFQNRKVVIDEMKTWFAQSDFAVLGRIYNMKYSTPFYDFDVIMEVKMQRLGNRVVPSLLRYNGNWDVPFKKRERGIFTATLYDFSH